MVMQIRYFFADILFIHVLSTSLHEFSSIAYERFLASATLNTYQKELYSAHCPRVQNVRSIGSNEQGLNPKVERLNGTVRDRETVMRGMDNAEAAEELMDAMRNHYNFIRPTQAIGGQTPAEAAGINLNLGDNKVESLMRQAAVHAKDAPKEPIVKGLGIRANKIVILNEKDCSKIKARTWLDKRD
jgi:Integrase core domain